MIRDDTQCPAMALDAPARASWNELIVGVLSHGSRTASALADTLRLSPNFALGHAVAGLLALTLARREPKASAQASLLAAQKLSLPSDDRGQGYIEALALWLDGRPLAAADRLEQLLDVHRTDVLAFKLAQAIRFMSGDRSGMLAACQARGDGLATTVSAAGFVAGCTAFALEEAGFYQEAERAGRRAIALEPRDAWGRHAVAHVFEMTGRYRQGIAFLESGSAAWSHCGNFGGHLFWHLALFLIEERRFDEVLQNYDRRIRAVPSDDFRDLANAISLLQRLELVGVDVGNRWDELGEAALRRAGDHCLSFADLHYLIALLQSGRHEAALRLVGDLLTGYERDGHDRAVACGIAARLARGMVARSRADHATAAADFASARRAMGAIGGSRAQRDLFEQLYLHSLVASGDQAGVAGLLRERMTARGGHNLVAAHLSAQAGESRTQNAAPLALDRPRDLRSTEREIAAMSA